MVIKQKIKDSKQKIKGAWVGLFSSRLQKVGDKIDVSQ